MQTAQINVTRTAFENGLTLLTAETHDVPVVTATIWYGVGSAHESAGQTGISHFLEHLMFKGTPANGKGMIDFLTASNGGNNNAGTIFDYTMYYFNFSADRWELALQIEADRMRHCLFDPDEFEAERAVILEELKQQLDSPWGQLAMRLESAIFPATHPYHHPVIGWQQDVERISRDDMLAYYATHYAPNNATLIIVGDVQTARVIEAVHRHFGEIPPAAAAPPLAVPAMPQQEQRLTLMQDSGVKRLQMGYHTVNLAHPDTFVLEAIDYLLNHGKTSRLHQRLVEQEQLAVFTDVLHHSRKLSGVFYVLAALRPGVSPETFERALDEEIARLQTEPVSAEELQKVKNMLAADFLFDKETTSGLAHALGEYEILGSYDYFFEYPQRIEALTADDIMQAAQTYLTKERRTVAWGLPQDPERECAEFDEEDAALPPCETDMVFHTSSERFEEMIRTHPQKKIDGSPEFFSADPHRFRHHRWTLPNGLTVLFLEHHLLPIVTMEAFVDAGQKYESDAQAGIAVLTGQLLEEGTTTRSALDIALAIESVGGVLEAQSQGVSAQVLSKDLALGMDLLSDVLMRPIFDAEQLKKKRQQILSSLEEDEDNPAVLAYNLFREFVYGAHPYHRPRKGYKQTVRRLRRADLFAYYQTYFRPNNTILAIVGDAEPAAIHDAVRQAFDAWPFQAIPQPPAATIAPPVGCVRKHLAKDKEQVHINLGHLGVTRMNPDFYTLFAMDHILGTGPGFTDRISRTLRDELGLAYSVSANISQTAEKEPGMFAAYIGTSPKYAERAIDGFLKEIRTIRREPVLPEELALAKNYITGSYVFNFETSTQLTRYLINVERYQLGEDFIWRFPQMIDQISAEDILRVAQRYLDEENYYIASAGKSVE